MPDPSIESKANPIVERVEGLATQLSEYIARAEKRNKWKDILIPTLALLVALAGVLASTLVQVATLKSQAELKQYEVTFLAKQRAYANFMSSIHAMFFSSTEASKDTLFRNIDNVQAQTFAIQPFLSSADQAALWKDTQELIQTGVDSFKLHQSGSPDLDAATALFLSQREKVRNTLSATLFGSAPR
jgi:hypothetical protein